MDVDSLTLLITAAILLLGLALAVMVVVLDVRQQNRLLDGLAIPASAVVKRGELIGRISGRDFLGQVLRSKHGANSFRVKLKAHIPFDLLIYRKNLAGNVMSASRLVQPALSGNQTFDDEFLVLGKNHEIIQPILQNPDWQRAIDQLFKLQVNHVEYNGQNQTIAAVWQSATNLADATENGGDRLVPAAEQLLTLETTSHHIEPDEEAIDDGSDGSGFTFFMALYGAMLAFGGFAAMVGEVEFEPLSHVLITRYCLLLSALLWAVLSVLVFRVTRRHLLSHHQFLGLLFMGVVCIPFAVYGSLVNLNGALGQQTAQTQRVEVIDNYRQEDGGTFHHFIRYSDESTGEIVVRRVHRSLFKELDKKSKGIDENLMVEITTYPGALGIPWSTPGQISLVGAG